MTNQQTLTASIDWLRRHPRLRRAVKLYRKYDTASQRAVVDYVPRNKPRSVWRRQQLHFLLNIPFIAMGVVCIVGLPIGTMLYGQYIKSSVIEVIGFAAMVFLVPIVSVVLVVTCIIGARSFIREMKAIDRSSSFSGPHDYAHWDEVADGPFSPTSSDMRDTPKGGK